MKPRTTNATIPTLTILSVLLSVFVSLVMAPGVWAIEAGGVGGRPAQPQKDNERSKSIFIYKTDAGKTINDAVEIFNNDLQSKTVQVYAVDSQVASGGSFACAQKADTPKNVGSWIGLSQDTVTLEPGKSTKIPFLISVPKDAAPGEHDGCIAIQDIGQTPVKQGNGISISTRSAIRVAITVNGDIRKQLSITHLSLQKTADAKLLASVSLKNSGNVSLDTNLSLQLKSLGLPAANRAGGDFPALAGAQSDFNFQIEKPFWGGFYTLSAAAIYNPDTAASLGEKTSTQTIGMNKVVFITPQPFALAIELAVATLLLIAIGLIVRSRLQRKAWQSRGRYHVVLPQENIQDIARQYHVGWKRVAQVNRIKAPYALTAGQQIIVPKSVSKAKPKTSQK